MCHSLTIVLMAVMLVASAGCATKGFVRDMFAKMDAEADSRIVRLENEILERSTLVAKAPGVRTVSVLYATTRRDVALPSASAKYESEANLDEKGLPRVNYGICHVSLPPGHRTGQLESPFLADWPLARIVHDLVEDERKHVMVFKVERLRRQEFDSVLRGGVEFSREKEILVFVHGFNVLFRDACRRAGQLAWDMRFPGPPVLFSWPAGNTVAGVGVLGYAADLNWAQWSAKALGQFIEDIAAVSGAERVHVVAHSAGARAMVQALEYIATRFKAGQKPILRQVILAAPAINAHTFRQIATEVQRAAEHITIYASEDDKALQAATVVEKSQMLGQSKPAPVVVAGSDTIDVSIESLSVLEHSYYGDNRVVVDDIEQIVRHGRPASERTKLELIQPQGYWRFRR